MIARNNLRFAARGIALPIVLLILLAITGLSLYSARYATLSERASRNQLDAERARQAAESALRDAERDVLLEGDDAPQPPGSLCDRRPDRPLGKLALFSAWNATCAAGQCQTAVSTDQLPNWTAGTSSEPWWPDSKGGQWNNDFDDKPRGSSASCTFNGGVPLGTFTGAPVIAGVARQPEYLIELLRRGTTNYYRITARGFGAQEQTQVVLQSYFNPFQ
jgi:type IV pilus assembly protein PilX